MTTIYCGQTWKARLEEGEEPTILFLCWLFLTEYKNSAQNVKLCNHLTCKFWDVLMPPFMCVCVCGEGGGMHTRVCVGVFMSVSACVYVCVCVGGGGVHTMCVWYARNTMFMCCF